MATYQNFKGKGSQHVWNGEFCNCGQDSVTCQGCAHRICGSLVTWHKKDDQFERSGNFCWRCESARGYNPKSITSK